VALVRVLEEQLRSEFPWVEQVLVVKPQQETPP
jgi:hypothetical protein